MKPKAFSKFAAWALFVCALLGAHSAFAETVADPVFDPPAGSYFDFVEVSLTCATPGATIYYTTDGSDPTIDNADVYDPASPIDIEETTVVKAFADKMGDTDSGIVSATYTIAPSPPPTVKVIGPKVFKTKKPTVTIRGTSTDAVEIDYVLASDDTFVIAKGVSPWRFKVRLKPGKNTIKVIAFSEFDESRPVTLKVTYLKKK